MNRAEIIQLIGDAIREFGTTAERDLRAIDEHTVLFGNHGILDSISLLNVLNVLEERIEERYGMKVELTELHHPLQSIAALADSILGAESPAHQTNRSAQKKVCLRAFEPEDYRIINAWRQDEEVYRLTTASKRFISSERDRQWVSEKIANNISEDYLAICLTQDKRIIGYISLSNIDYRHSRAEFSGIVIGDQEYRGHGYASEAIYLLLEYAFDELGLYRISNSLLSDNTVSLFIAKLMGFRQEGVLREYMYKSGRRHDLILMSLLRPEFELMRKNYSPVLPA